MFNKTKCKSKKYFRKNCLHYFSSEKILSEYKEDCLVTNGKKVLNERVYLLVLKIILNKYLFLLKFMLILNVF